MVRRHEGRLWGYQGVGDGFGDQLGASLKVLGITTWFFAFLLVGVGSYFHKTLLRMHHAIIWSYLYCLEYLPQLSGPAKAIETTCSWKEEHTFKPWKSDHMLRLISKKFGKIISKHNQKVSTGGKCGTPPQSIIPQTFSTGITQFTFDSWNLVDKTDLNSFVASMIS